MGEQPRYWAVAIAVTIAATGRPAAAQRTVYEADGTVNVGYTQTTRATFQADPMADPGDVPDSSVGGFFTEIRPGISMLAGSARFAWRFGYVFAGNLALDGDHTLGYSNQANAALAAQLTKYTLMTLNGSFAQGGTSALLSQQPAENGQPELRAPGNPNLLSVSVAEAIAWEVGRQTSLQHSVSANVSAPQNALGDRNSAVATTLSLERLYSRDTFGVEVRGSVSWLRPLQAGVTPYKSVTSSLLGRWNHDFSWQWNALVAAGVEQVFTDTGSRPLAFLPTGNASVRYTVGNTVAAVDVTHGTATNLQVGSVSISDRVTARGVITLDADKQRMVSFSAGFLHNEPIGDASPLVAAGLGNAVQADAAFNTAITKKVLAQVRYSAAYQFGQGDNVGSTLAHVFLVGVTATYSNSDEGRRRLPGRGVRVDGGDAEGFPVVGPN